MKLVKKLLKWFLYGFGVLVILYTIDTKGCTTKGGLIISRDPKRDRDDSLASIADANNDSIAKIKTAKDDSIAKVAEQKADRIKLIQKPLLADGSHLYLVDYLKQHMNDPESFQHVSTQQFDNGNTITVKMSYRGKNSFGALVISSVTAETRLDGTIISINTP